MTPRSSKKKVQDSPKKSRARKFRIMLLTANLTVDINGNHSQSYKRYLKHKYIQQLLQDLEKLFSAKLEKVQDNVYISAERLSIAKIERIANYVSKHYKGVEIFIIRKVKPTNKVDEWFED